MLGADAWMDNRFTYLDVFGYIRMVLLQHVCLPCSGHACFVAAEKIARQPISGVLLSEYSSEPLRLYSKPILQYVGVSLIM